MTVFQKIANVTLAILLLGSTLGITLHKHHCMGHVRNVAIMHQAEGCLGEGGMEMPGDCCKDTVEEFKLEELTLDLFSLDLTPDLYLIQTVDLPTSIELSTGHFSRQVAFQNYKPPLIERDIPVAIQSFLL